MFGCLRGLRRFAQAFGSSKEAKETKPVADYQKVVLFPGNGIGPEISQAVVDIFNHLKVPVIFEYHDIHTSGQTSDGDLISYQSLEALRKYKVGLKGPF